MVKPLPMFARLLQPLRHRRWLAEITPQYRGAERIALGTAEVTQNPGWLPTDQGSLDVTRREDFLRYWEPNSRTAFLAEHVWEHLTLEQATAGIRHCYEFLRPGGRLRIAVPDGYHPSAEYREHTRPGGTGPGAEDHKMFWTVDLLPPIFRETGFEVMVLEHWDAQGEFHAEPWRAEDGHILRSARFDPRNQNGVLAYTSLIVDGLKPTRA